jgi:hypothetical protein
MGSASSASVRAAWHALCGSPDVARADAFRQNDPRIGGM